MSLPRRTLPSRYSRGQNAEQAGGKGGILVYQTVISILLILAGVLVNKINLSVMKPVKDMVTSVLSENYGLAAVSAAVQKFAESAGLDDIGVFKVFDDKTGEDNTTIEPIPSETTSGGEQPSPAAEASVVPSSGEGTDTNQGEGTAGDEGEGEKYIIAANQESGGIGGAVPLDTELEKNDTPKFPDNALDEKIELGVKLTKPVNGQVSSVFGFRKHPTTGQTVFHYGTDYAAPKGTSIKASGDGTVEETGVSSIFGKYVLIRHSNSVRTFYGHCDKVLVKSGSKVKAGKVIALVGNTGVSTGAHLHFEIRCAEKYLNPEKNLT